MNRNLISIALAAAATFGATASFAGDFPASGEFSGVAQISAPFTATFGRSSSTHSERASYNVATQGMPAAGEFSGVQEQTVAGPALTREQVRQALNSNGLAQPTVNGEDPESYAAAPSALTRQEVRQEGRIAMRTGQVATGERAI
jgi:hypothetical protein